MYASLLPPLPGLVAMTLVPSSPGLWPVLVPGVALLFCLALALLGCLMRKKRRTEGTYRPSAEECKQTGRRGAERPALPLPLPKEERLI
uniref:Crumbs homolog 3b n=1 Tax=Esox lucius TaxID=8010 RepID=A0A6Q2Z0Y1_ESOLU